MGTGDFDWVEADARWTLPAIGQSRAFRLYFREAVTVSGSSWSSTHPVESTGRDGSINGDYYAWHLDADGRWVFATAAPYPRNYYSVNPNGNAIGILPKQTTYRVDWKWTRTAATTYALDLRVFKPDGSLLADKTGIYAWGGNSLASNPGGMPLADWAITGLRIGINGGFSASGAQYVYYGGFAVCSDWCGAYSAP
jgi:hypothetical protein